MFLYFGLFLLLLLAPFIGYGLFLLIGYWLPSNRKHRYEKEGILVGIGSNGFHSEFVFPLNPDKYNWQKKLPLLNQNADNLAYQYLSFGWGDRAIYLDLTAWSELSWTLGFKTIFWPTPSLMRIVGFNKWEEKDYQSLFFFRVSKQEFNQLCDLILASFSLNHRLQPVRISTSKFNKDNYFFEAKESYHAFNTCNIWVNKILKKSGIRTALWSPLDKALLYHLKQSKATDVPLNKTLTFISKLI